MLLLITLIFPKAKQTSRSLILSPENVVVVFFIISSFHILNFAAILEKRAIPFARRTLKFNI